MNARAALSFLLVTQMAVASWAADSSASAAASSERGNYIGEAAEATVGRVFGVEGDAAEINYHVFELTSHSPANAAIRSGIIPGWGQYFNNERVKGSVLFLATLGAVVASVHLHNSAEKSYDDYQALGQKDSSLYDDYERAYTGSIVLGSAAAVLWLVGIWDAHHNAYHPLYSKNVTVDVAYADNTSQIRVKKSF